jgi:hypothetical protein
MGASSASAQLINPYERITNPRAMVDLLGDDTEPLKHRTQFGLWGDKDEYGHFILAQDSGAGIITHIWATAGVVDSGTNIRIYIDGQPFISSTFTDFFLRARGAFRAPLDTALAGGWVNDVQMPYRKSFKITYDSYDGNVYYAISWRPVTDASKLKSFQLFPNAVDAQQQTEAEKQMLAPGSPWDRSKQDSIKSLISIGASTSFTVADITGPAMIQELEFEPTIKDPWRYHNVFLNVFYDGSPFPAISAPLFDFFLSATSYKDIKAVSLKVNKNGAMVSYFPMPFARSCRIELSNGDTADLGLAVRIAYEKEPIDRAAQGYLHASFSESKPTRMGIYHPVLHTRGRGKLIGVSHHMPRLGFPVALEGDPIMRIDSNQSNYIRYTGCEDYYNGGWWFMGTTYTRPFAGFTNWFDAFYRFHHLDAMDFKESFDFDMQHGVANDVHDHYRTVAYYYKRWTSFWVSRDTIRQGELFRIAGNGYSTNEKIIVSINGVTIDSSLANEAGEFSRSVLMPGKLQPGKYHMMVNGEEKPEWTYVLSSPAIRTIADHQIPTLRERDTLLVTGTGFRVGEKINLFLDSIPLQGEFTTGPDYRFTGVVRMPYLPDREYHVVARGEKSGQIVAPYPIRLTRVQSFEFEKLMPPVEKSADLARKDYVSFFYHEKWSDQSFVYFEASGADSFVTFAFDVIRTDTFNVFMFATVGKKFGDYDYYLDGIYRGNFRGFKKHPYYDPWRSDTLPLGIHYLEEGIHTITFRCTGKQDSAEKAWLGADNLVLVPLRPLPIAPGTWTLSIEQPSVASTEELRAFPNPSAGRVNLVTSLTEHDSDVLQQPGILSMIDASGRVVNTQALSVNDLPWTPLTVDLGELPNGRYLISLRLTGLQRTVTLSTNLNLYR